MKKSIKHAMLLCFLFAVGIMFSFKPIEKEVKASAYIDPTEIHECEECAEETDEIIPYGIICRNCGGGIHLEDTTYNDWILTSKVQCDHYSSGEDWIYTRTVVKRYICDTCGMGFDGTSTERKIICHGSGVAV